MSALSTFGILVFASGRRLEFSRNPLGLVRPFAFHEYALVDPPALRRYTSSVNRNVQKMMDRTKMPSIKSYWVKLG